MRARSCRLHLANRADERSRARGAAPAPKTNPSSGLAPLEVAIRDGRDLRPLPPAQRITFDLTLATRDPAGLQNAMAGGSALTAAQFAARFGPDPARVASALTVLAAAGLTAHWTPGEVLLTVAGTASTVERFLGVSIHRFTGPDGTAFYSALTVPAIPASLKGVVVAITGLDNYRRDLTSPRCAKPGSTVPARRSSSSNGASRRPAC